jgi:hypothetical protein
MVYVGSTGQTVTERENNRISKLTQVSQQKLVKAELAIRWWNSNGNYKEFVTLHFQSAESKEDAFVKEHLLINLWASKLNFPHISDCMKRQALGFVRIKLRPVAKHQQRATGKRLWRKIRKRVAARYYYPPKSTPCQFLSKSMPLRIAWSLVYKLGSNVLQSFEAC